MTTDDPDSSRTQFWVRRWEAGKLPWDLGGIPQELSDFLARTHFAPAKVLVPGCGTGYEVRAFHQAGFDVTAIDFSGPAVAHAREVLGALGDKVIEGNFFKHDFGAARYGLVYERGFLCSLPPERWPITQRAWRNCCSLADGWWGCSFTARSRSRRRFH